MTYSDRHRNRPPASKSGGIQAARSVFASLALLTLAAALEPRLAAQPAPETRSASVAGTPTPNTISVSDYRDRIHSLDQLVAECQKAMTRANCPSAQVGPDIQLALPNGPRQIRFGWLRILLDAASESQKTAQVAKEQAKSPPSDPDDSDSEAPPAFQPRPLPQQLADARKRLAADAENAAKWAQSPPAKTTNSQRETLDRILAAKEYHPAVAGPSLLDRALEKAGNWIDDFLGKLEQAGFKSKWVGRTAEILFGLALSIALVWFLIRLERQGRLAAMQLLPGTGGAASARDWQLWLEDARGAAAQGAWRDAIHLIYWASISRLESLGLWPADRARTPREYLALLTQENAHHADLKALTRSFERTWYAGRPAAEADFRRAADLAAKLGIPAIPISSNAGSSNAARGAR